MHGLDIIIRRNHEAAGREAAADYRDGEYRRCNKVVVIEGQEQDKAPERDAWASFITAYQGQREADDAQYGKYQP